MTSNDGTTWTNLNSGLPSLFAQDIVQANSILFVGTAGGVFLSTDNGNSWDSADTTLRNDPIWEIATNGRFLYAADSSGVVWSHAL